MVDLSFSAAVLLLLAAVFEGVFLVVVVVPPVLVILGDFFCFFFFFLVVDALVADFAADFEVADDEDTLLVLPVLDTFVEDLGVMLGLLVALLAEEAVVLVLDDDETAGEEDDVDDALVADDTLDAPLGFVRISRNVWEVFSMARRSPMSDHFAASTSNCKNFPPRLRMIATISWEISILFCFGASSYRSKLSSTSFRKARLPFEEEKCPQPLPQTTLCVMRRKEGKQIEKHT